jgi:hypothetical protein
MYDLLATPNMFRTASGAPGPAYYQQQADYKIDIELDDKKAKWSGSETIYITHQTAWSTYGYNWIKIKQRRFRFPCGKRKMDQTFPASTFFEQIFAKGLDRGFNLEYVKDANGNAMSYTVNHTMMRINLATDETKFYNLILYQMVVQYNDYQNEAVQFTNSLKRRKQIVCNCSILS